MAYTVMKYGDYQHEENKAEMIDIKKFKIKFN
jgi:hypothetical protein